MQCYFCKENLPAKVHKCKNCGEFLGVLCYVSNFLKIIFTILPLMISIYSVILASEEIKARKIAETNEKAAQQTLTEIVAYTDKAKLIETVQREIPFLISESADLTMPLSQSILRNKVSEIKADAAENPTDVQSQKRALYVDILLGR